MSSSSLHRGSDERTEGAEAKDAEREGRPSGVRITVIVQDQYRLHSGQVTGKQIKETANVPPGFVLYRRVKGGNEPISDDVLIEPHGPRARLRGADARSSRLSSSLNREPSENKA